eukprot:gene1850-1129_t
MAQTKEKKSFKKFAKKHLSTVIETRRKTAKSKKEKIERVERKKAREAKEAAREEKEHVEQLERLKDTDPEFFSYLETEDPTLLEFDKEDLDVVSDGEGSDAETDTDDEGTGEEEAVNTEATTQQRVSQEELDKLSALPNVEKCIDIFVSALRELGHAVKEKPKPSTTRKFEDPGLVKKSLLQLGQLLGKNVGLLVSGKGALKSPRTRYLVKRYLFALSTAIAESSSDVSLVVGLLQSLIPYVPLLHFVKGMTKMALKTALQLCTAAEEAVRVTAYVVVRAIATRATGTRSMYQSTAFKGIFLTLVRTAFHYNIHNRPVIGFLMNCVVDLYGTDMEAAYQHTFVYLRQLGVYLRAALQQQTASNVRAVANWQFIAALRTWGAVVSTYSDPSQLGPLMHPVVQIATGMMDLFSSPRLFPMHLQIIEVLNHISSRSDGIYIPVSPYLLRILTSPSVSLASSGNTSHANSETVELPFTIRVKKSQAKSPVYHRELWTEALYLLTEHLATHAHIIGFPEVFWAVESTLKKLKGEVKNPQLHSQISRLTQHMSSNAQRIKSRRDAANFGPCDLAAVKQFEETLKRSAVEKGGETNGLLSFFKTLRQHRIDAFALQQKNVQSRSTLEGAVEKRLKQRTAGKKRSRSAQ